MSVVIPEYTYKETNFILLVLLKFLKKTGQNVPLKIITPKYKIMIVKEIRLFSYIRDIRKGLKILFSCLCCGRNTKKCSSENNNSKIDLLFN